MGRVRISAGTRPPRATIIDVAREAAVSPATVSRVLTGTKPVSADLERRVRAVVNRLGYRPNPAAQGLLRGAAHAVGVVVPDVGNPYFAEVLKGVTNAAEKSDFRTLIADTGERMGAEFDAALELSRWADGVVLCSPRMPQRELVKLAQAVPHLVCVNRLCRGGQVPAVVVDFEAGIAAICRHLRELGHRRIAYLRGPARAWSERARQRALRAASGPDFEVVQVACGSSSAEGHRAADAALATRATAVMAFSDYVALGVLARFDELGVSVPHDVSLTGFDDIALSRLSRPRLTTVEVSQQDLGRRAWELLTSTGETDETGEAGDVDNTGEADDTDTNGDIGEADPVVTVSTRLIGRDSTAPPAPGTAESVADHSDYPDQKCGCGSGAGCGC